MASMTIVYVAALLAGACLVVTRLWLERPAEEAPAGDGTRGVPADLGLPGTRAERSDEYLAGGGVGGAEGDGSPPSYHAPADGGIGGAEGDDDEAVARRSALPVAPLALSVAARFTFAFGAVGLLFRALWRGAPQGVDLAVAGVVAILVAGLGSPVRVEGHGTGPARRGDGSA